MAPIDGLTGRTLDDPQDWPRPMMWLWPALTVWVHCASLRRGCRREDRAHRRRVLMASRALVWSWLVSTPLPFEALLRSRELERGFVVDLLFGAAFSSVFVDAATGSSVFSSPVFSPSVVAVFSASATAALVASLSTVAVWDSTGIDGMLFNTIGARGRIREQPQRRRRQTRQSNSRVYDRARLLRQ